jgi:uncharacterized protein YkwD
MLRPFTLAVVLAVAVVAPAAASPLVLQASRLATPLAPTAQTALGGSVVQELNRVRATRGLPPLRHSASLAAAARKHSTQMARFGFFDHSSPDGTPFWRRIERFYGDRGFSYWEVGENIFWQSPAAPAALPVVREWLASPPHRANLLARKWREVGVGVVNMPSAPGVYRGRPVTIVTVDFGLRR